MSILITAIIFILIVKYWRVGLILFLICTPPIGWAIIIYLFYKKKG